MAFSLKSGVSTPVALVGGAIGVGVVVYALWNGGAVPEDDAASAVSQAEQTSEPASQETAAPEVTPEPEVVEADPAPAAEAETVEAEPVTPVENDDAAQSAEAAEETAEDVATENLAVEEAEPEAVAEVNDVADVEEPAVTEETETSEVEAELPEETLAKQGEAETATDGADAEINDTNTAGETEVEVADAETEATEDVTADAEDASVAENTEEPATSTEAAPMVASDDIAEASDEDVVEASSDDATEENDAESEIEVVEVAPETAPAAEEIKEPVVEVDTAVPARVETAEDVAAQAEETVKEELDAVTMPAEDTQVEEAGDATAEIAENAPEPAPEPEPEPEPVAVAPNVDVAAPDIAVADPAPVETSSDTELAALQPLDRDDSASNTTATIPEPVAPDAVTDQIEPNTRQPTAIVMAPQVSEAAGIAAPQFDLVRVDKSGSTVVAGRAEPNTEVAILQNGQTVATVTASSRGEFVALFETDVQEQAQSLELASRATVDGPQVFSESSVIVLGRDLPQIEDTSSDVATDVAPAVIQATPEAVRVLQPVIGLADLEAISLDSISYNASGDVVLAGRGRPKNVARAYVDGKIQGETSISDQGSWRVTLDGLQAGRYVLRIDEVAPDGAVASRVESPFQRVYPTAENLEALSSERQVVIQRGDNLWNIARVRYGEGFMYTVIYDANTDQIRDPDLIYPGQIFDVPKDDTDQN